jgi:hypothetical protein
MKSETSLPAAVSRAFSQAQSSIATSRLPAGALPLIVATLILIVVPIARAASTEEPDAKNVTTGGAGPQAGTASTKLSVSGRVLRDRVISGRSVKVAVRAEGSGVAGSSLQLSVRRAGSKRWHVVDKETTRSSKRRVLEWDGNGAGRYQARISVKKNGRLQDRDDIGRVYVFEKGHASYYGPGLWGSGLACGGRLTQGKLGVAHKTLPCGTKVSFTLGSGRVVTARVIDRGPFIAGRDWDLTAALKRKLGFGDIGAVYAAH